MKQDNEFNQATGLKGHWAHVLAAEGSLLTAEGNIPASMRLAQLLLQKGRSHSVLAYLEECKTLWEAGREQLDEWIGVIRSGADLNFGSNLNY